MGFKPRINVKSKRGGALIPRERALHHAGSKVRYRVERGVGAIGKGTRSRYTTGPGLERSKAWIGRVNLWDNRKRLDDRERTVVAVSGA